MKSILEINKESYGDQVRKYIKEAWYFEKWYEKIILITMLVLSVWKIKEFVF